MGGSESSPASTSATCRQRTADPRAELAGDIHEAAEIAAEDEVRAAARDIAAAFFSTMAFEISGYFTENRPPKPQQVSLVGHLDELEPVDGAEKPARLGPDAELAQPRAGVMIGGAGLEACRARAVIPRTLTRNEVSS